jgi:hypothetical protein
MAEPADLVLSYTVNHKGVVDGSDKELKDALAKGYRVVDVLTSQPGVGGASSALGFTCVTVVLTQHSPEKVPYRSHLSK